MNPSLLPFVNTCANKAKKFTDDASVAHLLDMDSWEMVSTDVQTTPQQDNGYDCGVRPICFLSLLVTVAFT